eukprot:1603482-Amphidinium_carterae.1
MDQSAQSVQSMLLITLGVIPLSALICIGVSQKVMSVTNQRIKSVIRCVIRVTTQRNQRKVKVRKGARDFLNSAQKWKTKKWETAGLMGNVADCHGHRNGGPL